MEDKAAYLPTPEEIAARCLDIQQGWTPEEFDRRHVHYADDRNAAKSDYKREPYVVPTIRVCDIAVAS